MIDSSSLWTSPPASPADDAANALILGATLDSLITQIAILDAQGVIIAVNAAWRRFAQSNGFDSHDAGVGFNYLNVCAQAEGDAAGEAPEVLAGLRAVFAGQTSEFYLEYPCHSPSEVRWFSLRATPFCREFPHHDGPIGSAPLHVVVAHEDITARKLTEIRLREESQVIETLYHVGQVVAGEPDLNRIVETVAQAAMQLTGAHIGAFLPPHGDRLLSSLAQYATTDGKTVTFHSLQGQVPALAAPLGMQNCLVRLDDARQTPLFAPENGISGFPRGEEAAMASHLVAPLASRSGQRLGAMILCHPTAGHFKASDERVLQGLASQAAVALENALLLESARRDQQAITASEARYRFVIESIPQMVWITDARGYHEYFNAQWFTYTGQSRDLSLGEGWALPLHPEDVERSRERWNRSLESGEPYEIEYRFRRHDGTYRWFLGRALPFRDESGRILKWFGTCTDIEDQKQAARERSVALEREAGFRREAEAANRLKDEFLAVVSHELRTPLTPILGWIHLLKTEDFDSAMRRQAYDTIERNATAQTQIVNDLLDVSRIISGKLKLEVRPIELARVVEAALETVEPAARERGVKIIVAIADQGRMVGDGDRLKQVMWNLLSNAVKFTPPGGRVEVSLRRVEAGLEIEVRDSGQGIDPAFLPHVFERFRQADGSPTRRYGGLGIGLSIVHHLVEQHGGEVSAYSAGRGQGSSFTVRLPLAPPLTSAENPNASQARLASPRAPETPLAGVSIVVVDDERDARFFLEKSLLLFGARVRSAASAAQALQLIENEVPDLLISDIGMPGEDGYSLIKRVRHLPAARGGELPALALTAYARAEDRDLALSCGYQNHLAKPVAPADLVAALARLLE